MTDVPARLEPVSDGGGIQACGQVGNMRGPRRLVLPPAGICRLRRHVPVVCARCPFHIVDEPGRARAAEGEAKPARGAGRGQAAVLAAAAGLAGLPEPRRAAM